MPPRQHSRRGCLGWSMRLYAKLYSFSSMWQHGYDGEVPSDLAHLTPDHPQIEQVIALAASTVGFPQAVAAFSWVREVFERPAGSGSVPT